jgi:phosphatidylcholine synthase
MGMNLWVNLGFLTLFNILVFVPIKYIYPTRTTRLKKLTLILSYLFGALGVVAIILYPDVPMWIIYASFGYIAYYVGLSLWPRTARLISPPVAK